MKSTRLSVLSASPRILNPGRNCWTAEASADESGLLIDANSYYRAFYQASCEARDSIMIAGWRFNSDLQLLRGREAEGAPFDTRLFPFLKALCGRNRELRIYVLAWDFSVIYASEWELFQESKFQTDGIEFRFDAAHAVGGSHHQKFAVIDGHTAFVGGLDFCADDWDDRAHLAHRDDRADSGNPPHGPYHDIQAFLQGPAAAELSGYFRTRWKRAGGKPIEPSPPASGPFGTPELSVTLGPAKVALSRNEPALAPERGPVQEIRNLYLDSIASAEELIYVENQYFSSEALFRALLDRMSAKGRSKLDIVMVLPSRLPSWVEAVVMGPARLTMLDTLRATAAETGHRLGLYYPAAAGGSGEVTVLIHSKLMIVDDRLLTVGSANLSNRSMGLDTELNVSWEAPPGDEQLQSRIRTARLNLLAEHCGTLPQIPDLGRNAELVERLGTLAAARTQRLRLLTRDAFVSDREWLETLEQLGLSLDPNRPLDEFAFESLGIGRKSKELQG